MGNKNNRRVCTESTLHASCHSQDMHASSMDHARHAPSGGGFTLACIITGVRHYNNKQKHAVLVLIRFVVATIHSSMDLNVWAMNYKQVVGFSSRWQRYITNINERIYTQEHMRCWRWVSIQTKNQRVSQNRKKLGFKHFIKVIQVIFVLLQWTITAEAKATSEPAAVGILRAVQYPYPYQLSREQFLPPTILHTILS